MMARWPTACGICRPYEALEPHISAETMRLHHDEHHRAYVDKANAVLDGTGPEEVPARDVLTRLDELAPDRRDIVRDNVGGDVNHALFWESMTPGGSGQPAREGRLAAAIRGTFGAFASCDETLKEAALSQFGSGWAWLVCDGYRVLIVTTSNQDCPISDGLEPLLGIDVWEHAYYLDHSNRRADYVDAWLTVVDWDVVERRYAHAPVPDVGDILDRPVTVCGVERRGRARLERPRRQPAEARCRDRRRARPGRRGARGRRAVDRAAGALDGLSGRRVPVVRGRTTIGGFAS